MKTMVALFVAIAAILGIALMVRKRTTTTTATGTTPPTTTPPRDHAPRARRKCVGAGDLCPELADRN